MSSPLSAQLRMAIEQTRLPYRRRLWLGPLLDCVDTNRVPDESRGLPGPQVELLMPFVR